MGDIALRAADIAWQDHAACLGIDPEIFFPPRGASARPARAVCCRCVVQLACLRYALSNQEQFGIWGGMSELERRKVRRLGPEVTLQVRRPAS